jgi:hypothetical protein
MEYKSILCQMGQEKRIGSEIFDILPVMILFPAGILRKFSDKGQTNLARFTPEHQQPRNWLLCC